MGLRGPSAGVMQSLFNHPNYQRDVANQRAYNKRTYGTEKAPVSSIKLGKSSASLAVPDISPMYGPEPEPDRTYQNTFKIHDRFVSQGKNPPNLSEARSLDKKLRTQEVKGEVDPKNKYTPPKRVVSVPSYGASYLDPGQTSPVQGPKTKEEAGVKIPKSKAFLGFGSALGVRPGQSAAPKSSAPIQKENISVGKIENTKSVVKRNKQARIDYRDSLANELRRANSVEDFGRILGAVPGRAMAKGFTGLSRTFDYLARLSNQ